MAAKRAATDLAIVDALREPLMAIESLDAACLFGSAARSSLRSSSDIDLLLLISSRGAVETVRQRLPALQWQVSLSCYTHTGLAGVLERRASFAMHLRREGIVVFDRAGRLVDLLGQPRLINDQVAHERAALARRIGVLEDLEMCNGNFLPFFSRIYATARSAAMMLATADGTPEFDSNRAFDRVASGHRRLHAEIAILRKLRPFYQVARGHPCRMPFHYVGANAEALQALLAIKKLLAA